MQAGLAVRPPQIVSLLLAPGEVFRQHIDGDAHGGWRGLARVVAALSVPIAVVGAAIAMGYAETLLVGHYVANVMLLAASFGIQSFAAAFVGRLLYRRPAPATLRPFALTLVPHELFFVAVTLMLLLGAERGSTWALGVLALACAAWNVALTYLLFRSFGTRLRGAAGVLLHYATIAILVGLYMRAQDLLPYPAGVP